jgi:hypothetical protein
MGETAMTSDNAASLPQLLRERAKEYRRKPHLYATRDARLDRSAADALELRDSHTRLIDLYDRVHLELDNGKAWQEIDNGLREGPHSYEGWQAYMQQRIIRAFRTIVHASRVRPPQPQTKEEEKRG